MAKHYKETPWWWYILVLVVSFVIGLVVVIKENITLPAWAYIVSLLLGMFIAPLVGYHRNATTKFLWSSDLTFNFAEHPSLFPVWQRHCHKQLVKDVSWSHAAWPTSWKHVFCRM